MKIRKDRIDTNEQKTTTRNSQRIIIHKEKKPIGLKGPGVNLILSVPESKDKNIKLFNSFQKKEYWIRFKTKKKYFDIIVDSSDSTVHFIISLRKFFNFKTSNFSNLEGKHELKYFKNVNPKKK